MRRPLIALALLPIGAVTVPAQVAPNIEVGAAWGRGSEYYHLFGAKGWHELLAVRADAFVLRTRVGDIGLALRADGANSWAVSTCDDCQAGSLLSTQIRRAAFGPEWRTPRIGPTDVRFAVLGGLSARHFRSAPSDSPETIDRDTHSFYAGELSAGLHVGRLRVGGYVERGRVTDVVRGVLALPDPAPGGAIYQRGTASYERAGIVVSYVVWGRKRDQR